MPQSHLFVIDPIASLNLALDSTLRLAFSLSITGHKVFACQPSDIQWNSDHSQADVKVSRIIYKSGPETATFEPLRSESLAYFSAIHMRKDPPFDINYITTTWLLESVVGKTKLYNMPAALRSLNEKLAIFKFPEACKPALVSAQQEELLRFIVGPCDGDAVLKPLTEYGGRGVIRLQIGSKEHPNEQDVMKVILKETNNGQQQRLVQAFDKSIFDGEVRAFFVGGTPLAWCLKKPASGQFLANTRAGATLHDYVPGTEERERATKVAKLLRKDGVEVVGFDLLGGYISEINLTSPRLLHPPKTTVDYYDRWAQWCIQDCEV